MQTVQFLLKIDEQCVCKAFLHEISKKTCIFALLCILTALMSNLVGACGGGGGAIDIVAGSARLVLL